MRQSVVFSGQYNPLPFSCWHCSVLKVLHNSVLWVRRERDGIQMMKYILPFEIGFAPLDACGISFTCLIAPVKFRLRRWVPWLIRNEVKAK